MGHIHELYDFVVAFFIVHEDMVLLVNHPRYDLWIPPGGHIELDEDPDAALLREIKEETGLDVEILSPRPEVDDSRAKFLYTPQYMDVHEANPPHKHIALNYFARATNKEHVISDEHTDMKWFTAEELEESRYNLGTSIKFLANEALKAVKA